MGGRGEGGKGSKKKKKVQDERRCDGKKKGESVSEEDKVWLCVGS